MEWYGQLVSQFLYKNLGPQCVYRTIFDDLGLVDALQFYTKHFSNPSSPAASSALRISLNTGEALFYGLKFKVEKVCRIFGTFYNSLQAYYRIAGV